MPEACPYIKSGCCLLFLLTVYAGLFLKAGCNLVENIVNYSRTVNLEILPFVQVKVTERGSLVVIYVETLLYHG